MYPHNKQRRSSGITLTKSLSFCGMGPSCKEPYHDSSTYISRGQTNLSSDQKMSVHCTFEPSIFVVESLMELSSLGEQF